jgi:hypothetical protein
MRGWVHPQLKIGFECVSDTLLDGMASRDMVQIVELGPDGSVAVIAPEDIIADRMGQYASGSAPDMLGQARPCSPCAKDSTWTIWQGASKRKRRAIMAFKTFKPKRDPIMLEELEARIARRRAELGDIDLPRNSGKRRTASKRALLKAIEDAGGKW